MERGVENERGVMRPENYQGFPMEGLKFSEMGNNANRRALRDINNLTSGATYRPAVVKRSLNDVAPIDNKNTNSFAGRRPITRRFAASIARQSLDGPQNANSRLKPIGSERQKRSQPPVQNTTCIETCEAIDVDDIVSPNDVPLPMVEEIDVMIDCELKEVEMEDLEAKLLKDIDSCDSNNPLAVVDYVDDIYFFYRETEHLGCVPPDYMTNQFDINDRMRAILIDWLIEVHYKFELVDETLFLTVNIIDRFLARQSIVRKKLQLVGVTAMLLACKYEEVTVPVVEDLILISDRAYTRDEVLQMERLMINTLQFNMSVPTPYAFMRRFLKAAHESDRRKIELLSSYIIELCLIEYEMLKFRPSMLAAAAVYTAQCSLNGFKHWSRTSELCTKYSEGQLFECSRMMVNFHHKAGKGKLTGVHRKYSTFKFGCAAKSEPALFMLDMKA